MLHFRSATTMSTITHMSIDRHQAIRILEAFACSVRRYDALLKEHTEPEFIGVLKQTRSDFVFEHNRIADVFGYPHIS